MKLKSYLVCLVLTLLTCTPLTAQEERVEEIPFGNMDQWIDRQIKESAIIGGDTKHVYAIGPTQTITNSEAYRNLGGSPGNGYCARMDTRMESVKVLGLVNITVLAAGSVFLGEMHEPITSTKDPMRKLDTGIPFSKKPKAIRFDYKIRMSDRPNRIRATGFSRIKDVEGRDFPEVNLYLQKRWEDKDGNIYAKRVGTMVVRYDKTTPDWQNNATYTILYGDITNHPDYNPDMMRLQVQERFAVNSKGESVPIQEVGWGTKDDVPTHLQLQFTSSHGGAYIGSPGNTFWVDNVRMVY